MTEKRVKRKLSAILSADAVGYSRLMGDDEVSTVRTLEAYRTVMADLIDQFRGRVVDSPGDNLLAEFPSVVDAVQCAVEIHEVIRAKNEDLPEDRRMFFRIGMNLGDIIEEGDRIYGDGVNIAARLEGLAEAGGICISGSAYEQIENKLALGYEYLGEHSVKNIAKPVKVYKVPIGVKAVVPEKKKDKKFKLKKQSTILGAQKATGLRQIFTWVAVSVIMTAVIVWAIMQFISFDGNLLQSTTAPGGNLSLFVSSAGGTFDPAISPDGKMLAFVAEDQGQTDLFVSRVAGGGKIRLTDDDSEESLPRFSPDGERILFTRLASETKPSEICVIPTLGGKALHLISNGLGATWAPDGKQIAFVLRVPGEGDALATSAADGTNISVVIKSNSTYPFFRTPSWSPDGKHLAVTRSMGGSAGEIWLVPLDGGPPRRLSNDPSGIFSHMPVFTPDGRGVVHQSNRAGATNLWVVPLNDGQPVRLTSGPGPDTIPSVAQDGSIAFANIRWRASLLIYSLENGQVSEIVTYSSPLWAPAFSPSGRELAFSRTEQDGTWRIWIVPTQGGTPQQLTSGLLPEIYPRFTPDGNSVIYNTWSSEVDRIWHVPKTGGPPTAFMPAHGDDTQYADISPDGKWLAFTRTKNGISYISIAAIDSGEERQLTEFPSTLPRWSPDGQWIAFSLSQGYIDGISVIRVDGTGMRQLSETGGWPVWWPDGKQLGYLNYGKDGSLEIRTVPFAGGPSKVLNFVRYNSTNNPFDISPDGTRLATTDHKVVSSDIWLLKPRPQSF